MSDAPQKSPWGLIATVGLSDMVLGIVLAVLPFTGMLAMDRTLFPIVGVVLAIAGGVIFVWARGKASEAAQ